jgi:hypothetical protein
MSAEFVLYYILQKFLVFSTPLYPKQIALNIFTFEILDDSLPHKATLSSL